MVAQGILSIAPDKFLDVKVSNLLNSYIKLPIKMKVAKCSPVQRMRIEPTAEKDIIVNDNGVQIYDTLKSKQEIMDMHYDTKQKCASSQEKY